MAGKSELFKLVGRILIENADANESIDETTEKAKGLGDALGGAGQGADDAGRKFGSSGKIGSAAVWMGNMFTRITDKAINLGKFIGKTGFGFDAAMEAYQNQFEALLGDADKASQLVADLQLLAKVSPLGMEGLANNAVSLLNTGTELADIIPTLEMLGNLALGDTNKMDSIVRAYTQILSKGQLMAQEMYQMGDAGVPIREIMTLYGGDAYADGSWYAQKMKDPTYKIMAEDMVNAFQLATDEGGKWHDYMFKMMDTWNGQVDRFGEEGKENLGALMNPFFEIAKSDVLPRLSDSMGNFGTWVSENQGTLEKMADAIGKLVTGGFDSMISAFTWMVENGESTKTALMGIGTALLVGAIAAHPYATAVMAVVAGLTMLKNRSEDLQSGEIFGKYSEEDLALMQKWVDAQKEVYNAKVEGAQNGIAAEDNASLQEAIALANQYHTELQKVDGLMHDYTDYSRKQGGDINKGIIIDVPTQVSEDSEANMQATLDGMALDSYVQMYTDGNGLQSYLNSMGLDAYVNMVPNYGATTSGVDGSHASGLDFVPRDGYLARLHYGEAVLTRAQADAFRNNAMSGDTSRMEAMFSQMIDLMRQFISSGHGNQQIVLDSGVLVGQLAPALDTQLGTISSRKGRRN